MKRRNFMTSLLALVPAFLLPKVVTAKTVDRPSLSLAQEVSWFDHGILRARVIEPIPIPNPMIHCIPNISGYGWSKHLPPLRVRYLAKCDPHSDGIQFGKLKEAIAYPLTANFYKPSISKKGVIYSICIRPCSQMLPQTVAVFVVDDLMYYGDITSVVPLESITDSNLREGVVINAHNLLL